jgi:hypothetical protein
MSFMREKTIAKAHGLRVFECTDMGPDDGNRFFVETYDKRFSSSVLCAYCEGELDGGRHGMKRLSAAQVTWLQGVDEELDQ